MRLPRLFESCGLPKHVACAALFAAAAACGSPSKSDDASDAGSGAAGNGDATSAEASSGDDAGNDGRASDDGAGATMANDSGAIADASLPTDAQLLGDAAWSPRTFTVVNRCTQTVWAAVLPATTFLGGLVEMAPGYAFEVGVGDGWSGRIWGKTGCATANSRVTCASDAFPASLAELTLTSSATGLDFYDVSLVDGFNLPIEIVADGHAPDAASPYDCGDPTCAVDLNAACPAPLKDTVDGGVIACANDECKVLGDNSDASPDCHYPNEYTRFFKTACPTAYSYPYDDPTSTFTCKGINSYSVVFCP